MNANLVLGVIGAMMYVVLFIVLAPLPAGLIIFFLTFSASLVTVIFVVIAKEMSARVMFPVKLRLWEPRHGSPIITQDTRAKRIIKKGIEYYVTMSGRRIKAPKRAHIIRGEKGSYIDMITPDGEVFFPFDADYDIHDPKFKALPEDQRTWLANQIESNIKVTTPPLDTLAKVLPLVTMITAVGILLVVFMIFTDQMPKFMQETSQVMSAQINALDQTVDKFTSALDDIVISAKQPEPVVPPPGF